MAALPTNRTTANSPSDHVADHNTLHAGYNKGGGLVVTLHATTQGVAIAAAAEEYPSNTIVRRCQVDLAAYAEWRMTVARGGGTHGANTKMYVQYSPNGGTSWFYLDGTASGAANPPANTSLTINAANAFQTTSWVTMPAGAKADVLLRLMTEDGDGTSTGNVGLVTLQARWVA